MKASTCKDVNLYGRNYVNIQNDKARLLAVVKNHTARVIATDLESVKKKRKFKKGE